MITITIDTNDAVFDPDPSGEVVRLLRAAADDIAIMSLPTFGMSMPLISLDGNTVGYLKQE